MSDEDDFMNFTQASSEMAKKFLSLAKGNLELAINLFFNSNENSGNTGSTGNSGRTGNTGNATSEEYNTPIPFGCGFMNLGNTCYMTATFHALSSIPEFVDYFLDEQFKDHSNKVLGYEFHQIYLESREGKRKFLSLAQLRKTLNEDQTKFNFPFPQDSQEYVRYVYEKILKEYPQCPLILTQFSLISKDGNHDRDRNVSILPLALPTGTIANSLVSFDDILKFNLSPYIINNPPKYMIVNMLLDESHKKKEVNLQVDLDHISLAPYCSSHNCIYRIIASMDHFGRFAEDGHDTAYRRIPKGWFYFNDSSAYDRTGNGMDNVNLGHSYHLVLQRIEK